jgi:hypothetical protein
MAAMDPLRDEDLIRDPAIRRAVAAHRATQSSITRSHHWPIGWLIIVIVVGVLSIVLIGLLRLIG